MVNHKEEAEKVLDNPMGSSFSGSQNYYMQGIMHAILSLGDAVAIEDEQIAIIRQEARREAAEELKQRTRSDTSKGAGAQLAELYRWISDNE